MTQRTKTWLFRGALMLTPVVFLIAVEMILRLFGVFAPDPLYVEVPNAGGKLLAFNALVAHRYVDPGKSAVPMLAPESFAKVKSRSTLRVLCLGESTTGGFPFDCQVPFPRQLRQILADAYPERDVEVLNAGISAISSYVIVDLLPELLRCEPDIVVIYAGHNEFNGFFGSSSGLLEGGSDVFTRAALAALRTHIGQGVKRTIEHLWSGTQSETPDASLMEIAAGGSAVPLGSPKYHATMDRFKDNLARIAASCAENHIPLVFGTLVSNERGMPPFMSATDTSRISRVAMAAALEQGRTLGAAGEWSAADSVFKRLLTLDGGNADAWYGLGQTLFSRGDTVAARRAFISARDYDVMRFRATSEANAIIKNVAHESHAGLADLDAVFARRSPGGIPGNDLLCDHLHPNPNGYYLMAAAFYSTIQEMKILPPPDRAFRLPWSPYGVTNLDWNIGLMKVFPLLHRWPFHGAPATLDDYVPYGDSAAAGIAWNYLFRENKWSRAHEMMAGEFVRRGDFEKARREYESIAVFAPADPTPYLRIAELFRRERNLDMRSAALEEALKRSSQRGMIAYSLALNEMELGHSERALRAMTAAANAKEMTPDQRHNAQFYVAGFLSDAGKIAEARSTIESILSEDPQFAPAKKFLVQLTEKSR
jgi:tetratricopeptide (TPR) repeat protein